MFTFLTVLELLITPRELIAVELCVQGPRCRCLIKTYILSSFAKRKKKDIENFCYGPQVLEVDQSFFTLIDTNSWKIDIEIFYEHVSFHAKAYGLQHRTSYRSLPMFSFFIIII